MVWGLSLVCVALSSSWVFMTGWSLLFTMKAWGHTMFMISCRTNAAAAEVLMLNPAKFSSSAIVAVPPDDDDALVAAPLDAAGATAMSDTDNAPMAMAAPTDRFTIPLGPIALPLTLGCPVTADGPAFASFTSYVGRCT